jgi:hypothetical protein
MAKTQIVFLLSLLLLSGCTKTYNYTYTTKVVAQKDTVAENLLKRENKELRREIYQRKNRFSHLVDSLKSDLHKRLEVMRGQGKVELVSERITTPHTFFQFNPDSFPAYFEYNARTDVFPPKGKIQAYRDADNKEWESFKHRPEDSLFFKAK